MTEKTYDVAIVGSGAGGGTVAKELAPLAAEGRRIVLLERGPRLADREFTGREIEMAEKLYVDSGGFMTRDRTMTLAFARAYGGSTVVYTGTSLPIPRAVVAAWNVPGLAYDDLLARTRKYLAENNAHALAPELINENNRLFAEGCRALGYGCKQFAVNVGDCEGTGLCNMGCPKGAKLGTNRIQLPAAERAGVEVVTNCRVERIAERTLHATVTASPHGAPSPWPPGAYRVRAKLIILCAGAIDSPALMLRSGLGRDLPALGRYFTCHPALTLVAQHDRPIDNHAGFPKSYYCDDFADSHHFLLETCMYFPFTTAKSLIGFGAEHSGLMRRFDRLQMILALIHDQALWRNRVTVDRYGAPHVDYHFTDAVLEAFVAAMRVAARIFFAAGAARVHAPAAARFLIERDAKDRLDALIARRHLKLGRICIQSAHPMGGCCMGTDPRSSVTTPQGRVHGLPWLHVADASLFPDSAGVNPYLTVMALADRVAQNIREEAGALLAA